MICHGLRGNEKNLDWAQAMRRAGWNAVTLNDRGSWGSPGSFKFKQNLEDADAALKFLRDGRNADHFGIDPKHIVLAGHSMGGWMTALTAAHDRELQGVIPINAADIEQLGKAPRDRVNAEMADNMEGLSGVTSESMADELMVHAREFGFSNAMDGLVKVPLFCFRRTMEWHEAQMRR